MTYRQTMEEMALPKMGITRMWHWERWEISELVCPPSWPILHGWHIIISIRSTNGSLNKSLWDSVKYLECTNVVLIPKHILNHSPVPYKGVWFDQSKIWSIQHRNLEIFFPWHQPLEASIRHIYVCSRKEPLLQRWHEKWEHRFLKHLIAPTTVNLVKKS